MALDVKIDAETVATGGTLLGGVAALVGIVTTFAKRQRAKGERWKEIELTAQNAAKAAEDVREEVRGEIAALRIEMNAGFQNLTNLIIGSK